MPPCSTYFTPIDIRMPSFHQQYYEHDAVLLSSSKKRPRKTVRFTDESQNTYHESPIDDTCMIPRNDLWYESSEMANFKKDVGKTLLLSENPDDFIGLERHMNLNRLKAKKRVVRDIVQYSQMQLAMGGQSADFMISIFAQGQTRWARTTAYGQGIQDYNAAYFPSTTTSPMFSKDLIALRQRMMLQQQNKRKQQEEEDGDEILSDDSIGRSSVRRRTTYNQEYVQCR